MKLSMIVVITSCAPHFARKRTGHEADRAAGTHRGEGAQRHREESGRAGGQREPHQRRREAARRQLPLGANVEEPRAKPHCDRESRADQRRGLVEHLPESIRVAPGALEHQSVHRAGRLSDGEDEQIADDDRHEERDERREHSLDHAIGQWPRGRRRGGRRFRGRIAHAVAPVMSGPSICSLASLRGTIATILPPYITATRSDSARISDSSAETSRIPVPASRAARRRA